jgi:hypothetical protein
MRVKLADFMAIVKDDRPWNVVGSPAVRSAPIHVRRAEAVVERKETVD